VLRVFAEYLAMLATVGLVAAFSAWLPFAHPALRHWVRHWGRVHQPGCNRCVFRSQRLDAHRGARDAVAASAERALAKLALEKGARCDS
jgi:hypothetical protein